MVDAVSVHRTWAFGCLALGVGWYALLEWIRNSPRHRAHGTSWLGLAGTVGLFLCVVGALVLEFFVLEN